MTFLLKILKSKNNLLTCVNAGRLMLVFSLAAVLIVNFQIFSVFFFADDFLLLYQISNWNPLEFIFSNFGGHLFIFRNFIFYCMFKLFGVNSVAYFSTVLLTHLGSAYILYKIIYLLTDKLSLAAAGMIIWGICPVNYATLAWYSSYAQILVGFFFLLFLYELLRIEKGTIILSMKIVIRWSIYLFLMAASYGTGLAVACLSPIAIVIILQKNDKKWEIAASMLPVIAIILLLFIFKDSIYYYFSGEVSNSNPVALGVVLSHYRITLEMFIRMCAYAIYCMAAFPLLFLFSTTKYPTAAFIISIPVVMLFIVLFSRSKEYRRRHYAVLSIIFIGLIGLTAYARAWFYHIFGNPMSTTSLEHRYYYVIFIVVILILILMADELLNIYPKILKVVIASSFIVIALSIYPSIDLARRNDSMNTNDKKVYYNTITDIEKTIMAYPEGSSVFIDNKMNEPISLFLPSDTDLPGKAAMFSITYQNNTVEGRRVYFVEKDCRVADKNIEKKKWRISSLIVSACDLDKKSN